MVVKHRMAFNIIKEQRMIRTIFYSLLQSAELIADDKQLSDVFVSNVGKFVRERTIIDEGTKEMKEVASELLTVLGWKSISINYNNNQGTGKVLLGRNRYIIKEVTDNKGTLLFIQAIFQGIGYHLFNAPTAATVKLSFSTTSHYEITLQRLREASSEERPLRSSAGSALVVDTSLHGDLEISDIFSPIFQKSLPEIFLFETAWKVITESYVANFSAEGDESLREALKNESMVNLSRFITKIIEEETEEEILNVSELIGEFIVKILTTKTNEPLSNLLQSTLQDRHAKSYLIYYECRKFCADKKMPNRCTFIRGMWVGILSEIYGIPIKIKELFHAGKRDRYCMMELVPDKN